MLAQYPLCIPGTSEVTGNIVCVYIYIYIFFFFLLALYIGIDIFKKSQES